MKLKIIYWPLTLLLGAFILFINYPKPSSPDKKDISAPVNGINFVAPPRPIEAELMTSMQEVKANWVAIVPYAFSRPNEAFVKYDYPNQWWGEGKQGASKTIAYAKSLGFKVMLKPHVWVLGQGWPGDYDLDSEEKWAEWEKNYRNYILDYARIAQSLKVEMLCIGTEFRKSARERPVFWKKLIESIRSEYDGLLTYAANWDNYQHVKFWDQLDYIGIDAYFPLSEEKTPSVEKLRKGWQKDKTQIHQLSKTWKKPVLFTEYGYKSIDYNTDGHWKFDDDTLKTNMTAQVNAYEALYREFWSEPWFRGGFLWKWHSDNARYGGKSCKQFTPQNKPVLAVIKNWYEKGNSD